MVDTITESFCERCGTRYEFNAPTRLNPLRKTRGLIGGLRNYVMSQDALSDAVGDAMRSEEEQLAAAQLDAFHESFNFCIDCRQYTCVNCWNDDAGRCRTCAPIAGTDDLAERLAASFAPATADAIAEPHFAEAEPMGPEHWPQSDLPETLPTQAAATAPDEAPRGPDGFVYEAPATSAGTTRSGIESVWAQAAGAGFDTGAADVVEPAPEPLIAAEAEPESVVAEELEPESVVAEELEPESVVAEELEPESVVAEELEPEPVVAEELEPEPVVAEELEPEPVAAEELEPEPVAAEELEPEPVVAEELEPEPVVAEELEPEPVVAEELERPPLRVVAWDEDAAYDLEPEPVVAEEPEPELVVAEEPEPELVVAEEPEPELVMAEEPEPEPVVAEEPERVVTEELEPEPEPVVAEEPEPVVAEEPEPEPALPTRRPIAPIGDTILRFPTRPAPEASERVAAEADSPELAARRAQLDLLGLDDPGQAPVGPTRPAVLPYRSRGAATHGDLAARAAAHGTNFWEASAREVAGAAANVGVQNCGQCGLSLSANARFCRRCGTRQAQSA